MRVTFVVPFVNLTGGIRTVLDHANWLHDHGHTVRVVYPRWPYRFHDTLRQQLGEFRRSFGGPAGVRWYTVRPPVERVPLIRTAFLPPADVVVATSWPTVYDVVRLGASRGKRVHLLMQDESDTGPADRVRAVYSLPYRRIGLAATIRDEIERRFGCRIDEIVPCGVNLSAFHPDGERKSQTVLMLYHPAPRKGAGDGLAALSLVRESMPHLECVLCGPIAPSAVPYWATFIHYPSDDILRRQYSSATAFLYPSRYEGFGLPPLEAMACGCPVVATRVGAVPEYAVHEESALLVEPGNVRELAASLRRLLVDSALQNRLSIHGLAVARRNSVDRCGQLFASALSRVMA